MVTIVVSLSSQVQFLYEAVSVSLCANVNGKSMNPFHFRSINKQGGKLGSSYRSATGLEVKPCVVSGDTLLSLL